jgi:hypothetical protein
VGPWENGGFFIAKSKMIFLAVFKHKGKIFLLQFFCGKKYSTYSALQRILRLPKNHVSIFFFQNSTQHLYQLFGENEDHFLEFFMHQG